MRRFIALAAALLLSSFCLRAQVLLSSDYFDETSFTLKAQVLDSLTNEPISFASVYLHHPKDTIITNFALTDTLGVAELKNVVRGDHRVCIEMLGYKPFYRNIYIKSDTDLEIIKLQQDEEQLKAALVSAIGAPMEVREDTVIYNASAFRTLSNDKLSDLLKQMPGIEVGSNGSVTVNGQSVSRLTVNGRTFFLGDQKAALDNLPAKIVDKVKVIDKETDAAEFSGIKSEKVKVMDVELKEEYKRGWLGNLSLGGGTSIPGSNDNEFIEDKDLLYSASGMLSAYGEKNQLTAIASANNYIPDGSIMIVGSYRTSPADVPTLEEGGLHSRWNVGANLNSQVIKNFDSDLVVSYSSEKIDKHSRTDRTSFQASGEDLYDSSERYTDGGLDKLNIRTSFENQNKDKYTVNITPGIGMYNYSDNVSRKTSTSLSDSELNNSESFSAENRNAWFTDGTYTFGIKNFGKTGRALTLEGDYSLLGSDGDEIDNSITRYAASGTSQMRNLIYDNTGYDRSITSELEWTEPLSEKWRASISAGYDYSVRNSERVAANSDGSANDYYSSYSDNHYTDISSSILAQYSKGKTTVQAGGKFNFIKNETLSRSYNIDTRTGEDEWQFVASPYLRLSTRLAGQSINTNIRGSVSRPSAQNLRPSFTIVNPTRITAGNIYLKPSISRSLTLGGYGNKGKTMLNYSLSASLSTREQVSAIWFDSDGIRYSVPVNSKTPSTSTSFSFLGNTTLTADRKLRLNYNAYISYSQRASYQSKGTMPGIDTDSFDYSSFMQEFWGNASGDRFYSGDSGFQTSKTRSVYTRGTVSLIMNLGDLYVRLVNVARYETSSYSLDSKANTNVFYNRMTLNPVYTSDSGFEFSTSLNYDIRRGYGASYNVDDLLWDFKVGKDINAFTLALNVKDILNRSRSFEHTISQNYVEDSYTNLLGRYITLSLTWNFGKANSAQSQRAQASGMMMSL